jgi:transposase-like protein|tara:strand:+ start:476 stop:718 length:243 start_codon:yes stop_codon:yes gene_type:complete
MGRAIDVDKRLDKLEHDVNEILLMLDELANTNTTQEHIDLHEATKQEEANDEGDGKSSGKSDKRKSTTKTKPNKDTGSSK